MTRTIGILVSGVFCCTVAGCASEEDYVSVFREQQKARQEITEILGSVRDEKSMEDAKAKLDAISEKCEAISTRFKALPAPSGKILKRLEREREFMQQTMDDLLREVGRIQKMPGGPEFLKQFGSNQQGLMGAIR